MKNLILILVLITGLISCNDSKKTPKDSWPAKLVVVENNNFFAQGPQQGESIVRAISYMYNIGDIVRFDDCTAKVVSTGTIPHDYQLDVYMDSVWLYREDTILVGAATHSKLDSLIMADNQ